MKTTTIRVNGERHTWVHLLLVMLLATHAIRAQLNCGQRLNFKLQEKTLYGSGCRYPNCYFAEPCWRLDYPNYPFCFTPPDPRTCEYCVVESYASVPVIAYKYEGTCGNGGPPDCNCSIDDETEYTLQPSNVPAGYGGSDCEICREE